MFFDISPVALSKLKQAAKALQVQVDTLVADISQCKLEVDHFDLVLLFFYSDRDVLPKVLAALKCGGVLICKLHVCSQSEARHQKPESLRDGAELRSLLPGLEILFFQERPVRNRGVVELIGRKLLLR